MKSKLLYLLFGSGIGSGAHYGYRYYNPERNINQSTHQMVNSYVGSHELEQGYLVNVLKSVGLMLKGFYHYGMDTKIRGFNYNSTYLNKSEIKDQNKTINHLYCIFSPTQYICGHPEIQHGGATATIIDQNMGYLAILHSKQMVATADLHVKYKRPIKKDQFYVLETEVTKREGRKIWVKGTIKELQTGEVKVQSNALFFTVNWDNQMSRILTKFFQVVNFKDYSQQHGFHTHQDYKQSLTASQVSQNVKNFVGIQHKKMSQNIKQSISKQQDRKHDSELRSKELDEKLEKLQQVIKSLEKKQNLIQIPRAEQSQVYREGLKKNESQQKSAI